MMKRLAVCGALVAALSSVAFGQTPAARTSLGTVNLGRSLMADGKPLPAGSYTVRLTDETPKPGVGQSAEGERYVEFVRNGRVMGREVATVISANDIATVAKGRRPSANGSVVEMLKGGDYWRIWINRGGNNYLINMPPA